MVRSPRETGSILMIAMVVVLIVAGMSAAFISFAWRQNKTTLGASQGESSLNSAEAGIDDAVNKLNAMSVKTWQGSDSSTAGAINLATGAQGTSYQIYKTSDFKGMDFEALNFGTVTDDTKKDPLTGAFYSQTTFSGTVNRGGYDVTITPAFYGNGQYTITSWGTHGRERKGLTVIVTPGPTNVIGDYGLVGRVTLTATSSNVFVDSYKSSNGTYASQATNTHTDGTTKYANANGHLGSNGDITVNNGIVFGNATPGPKSIVTTGKATITGSTTPAGADLVIPSQTYTPPGKSPLTWPKGLVTLGDGTATPTTYHYSTMVTSGKGAGITVKGAVILYVDGDIGMNSTEALTFADKNSSLTIYHGSGGLTLNGQTYASGVTPKASNLQIFSASTGDVKFNGGAEVYASVYAPDASFKQTGSSVFHGRMVANTIDIGGNMTFHRDEDVGAGPTSAPTYKIKSFNEAR